MPERPDTGLTMWVCDYGHFFRGGDRLEACKWTDGSPRMKGGFCGAPVTEVRAVAAVREEERQRTVRLITEFADIGALDRVLADATLSALAALDQETPDDE